MRHQRFLVAATLLGWVYPAGVEVTGQAARSLETGSIMTARAADDAPAEFRFAAETAGFLTVVVRGTDNADLSIAVTDDIGQLLPQGEVDLNLGGDQGAEQLTITVPNPGDYGVHIRTWSGSGAFRIASAWIAFPDVQAAPDPDGKPTTATVITEAPDGDLVIEVFREGAYGEAIGRSDQDMDGVAGNESLTARIEAGGTVHFKVASLFDSADRIAYNIRAGVL